MKALSGQKAIVTGASSGIGQAVAIELGRAGADVVVNYVGNDDGAKETVSKLQALEVGAFARKANVAAEAEVKDLFEFARRTLGRVDILVANAGIQRDAGIADMTHAAWQQVLDVNLTGQFLCCREAVREFRRQPLTDKSRAAGKIVCVSSVHQVIPWAGHANYAASKGGVDMMMQSLAQEVAGERIRVNGVAPGAIQTNINRDAWQTPRSREQLLQLIPYGRIGVPEDIARAVTWLVSDAADYVVGTTLFVDGGMTLYPAFSANG
ncbi:MAG TPA: glucose 1-dehydrogenase [Hyphomicrobiaceae bacterium]